MSWILLCPHFPDAQEFIDLAKIWTGSGSGPVLLIINLAVLLEGEMQEYKFWAEELVFTFMILLPGYLF